MPLGDQTSRPDFGAANREAPIAPETRGSEMVGKDRPHPAPRPSPDMAHESDHAAFDAAWKREAAKAEDHNCAARLETFKTLRNEEPGTVRARTFNRATAR